MLAGLPKGMFDAETSFVLDSWIFSFLFVHPFFPFPCHPLILLLKIPLQWFGVFYLTFLLVNCVTISVLICPVVFPYDTCFFISFFSFSFSIPFFLFICVRVSV